MALWLPLEVLPLFELTRARPQIPAAARPVERLGFIANLVPELDV
jgi:hypothetical protein